MLKKLNKRAVFLFLALIMQLCTVPMTAMAAPDTDIPGKMPGHENSLAKLVYEEPDGYYIATTPHAVEITGDGQAIKTSMTNEKGSVPEIPQTGDESSFSLWIGLGAIALGALVAMVIIRIKHKTKDDET